MENALQKLEKAEIVKNVYRAILNATDDFADTWFVEKDALHLSAIQYVIGMDPIPNISDILNSRDFD
jgi:type I restriction enzyme, R subunit